MRTSHSPSAHLLTENPGSLLGVASGDGFPSCPRVLPPLPPLPGELPPLGEPQPSAPPPASGGATVLAFSLPSPPASQSWLDEMSTDPPSLRPNTMFGFECENVGPALCRALCFQKLGERGGWNQLFAFHVLTPRAESAVPRAGVGEGRCRPPRPPTLAVLPSGRQRGAPMPNTRRTAGVGQWVEERTLESGRASSQALRPLYFSLFSIWDKHI